MKIITYNINGIRAAIKKDFHEWIKACNADLVCLQEIKALKNQFPSSLFESMGYTCYLYPAKKPGYSGVALLSKLKPIRVKYGMDMEEYDNEGRCLRLDFEDFSVMSLYMPSGSSSPERQEVKFRFLDDFYSYIENLKKEIPNLIICGDYNICHQAIDIHNPKSNAKSSGFLPEERAWFSQFLELGFKDAFRELHPDPHHYTWWSYRANARAKNLGWRIDYHLLTEPLMKKVSRIQILPEAHHSDHCPVLLEI